jgi:hypothetical protein
VTSSSISLTWADNASSESGFQIERRTGAFGAWNLVATVAANVTTFTDTGLQRRVTYRYRVRAFNASGVSAYSNVVTATTPSG